MSDTRPLPELFGVTRAAITDKDYTVLPQDGLAALDAIAERQHDHAECCVDCDDCFALRAACKGER